MFSTYLSQIHVLIMFQSTGYKCIIYPAVLAVYLNHSKPMFSTQLISANEVVFC